MNNKDILNLINENKIEELKAKIIAEIGVEDNKEIPTYKAIQRLANIAEKEQRTGKKHFDGTYTHSREGIAGASYSFDKTQIMGMCWGILLNGKITGLTEIKDYGNVPNLDYIIPKELSEDNYCKVIYTKQELNYIKNQLKIDKNFNIGFNDNIYPASQFVNLFECLEDAVIYAPKKEYSPLVIKGTNGTALICALRI